MRKITQVSFAGPGFERPGVVFGGALLKGNPKSKRPLNGKQPLHLVLRTGKSVLRLPKTIARVNGLVHVCAEKYGIRIYKYANVGNHLHLLIRVPRRSQWASFIRELTGRIALAIRQALDLETIKNFWSHRPFTRIVAGWKRAFQIVRDYVQLNHLEAEGFVRRSEIGNLRRLRLMFDDG